MRFCFGKSVAILGAATVTLFCSCEKHHVGELPEVQKEHVELAEASEENASGINVRSTSPAPLQQSTPPTPTPAEFFPSKP